MNRQVVRDMLQVAGVDMTEAVNAQSGLEMIERLIFDVVLVDLRMPGMDGLTAIEHIRRRPDAKASLPIIIITADTAINLRHECISRGADDLLLKPVAMRDLFDAIGRVLVNKANGDIPFF